MAAKGSCSLCLKNVHIIDRKATKGLLRYNRPVDGATCRHLIDDRLMPLLGSSWRKTNLSLSLSPFSSSDQKYRCSNQ